MTCDKNEAHPYQLAYCTFCLVCIRVSHTQITYSVDWFCFVDLCSGMSSGFSNTDYWFTINLLLILDHSSAYRVDGRTNDITFLIFRSVYQIVESFSIAGAVFCGIDWAQICS